MRGVKCHATPRRGAVGGLVQQRSEERGTMAQQTIVNHVDDIDGTSEATHPGTKFSLDGVSYEIDLSDTHRDRLVAALEEYIAAGRRVGGRRVRPTGGPSTNGAVHDGEQIRDWAREQGIPISDRGRIAERIVTAYREAKETPAAPKKPARKRSRAA